MACEGLKGSSLKRCLEANRVLKDHVKKEKKESNFNDKNFEMLTEKRIRQELGRSPASRATKKEQ